MIAIAFIIGIGLLTLYFGKVEDEKRNPNRDPTSRQHEGAVLVELLRNRSGHYVVSGTINQMPVEFILDTGATDVVIPAAVAADAGLTRGRPTRAMTANGVITVFSTTVDRLTIGDISLDNVQASINPAMAQPSILLGMSALKRIEFVQQGESLTLRQLSN